MTKTTKTKPRIFLTENQTDLIVKFIGEKERNRVAVKHGNKPSVVKKILWRQYAITPSYNKCINSLLRLAKTRLNRLNDKV